jgi:hypothetical protein
MKIKILNSANQDLIDGYWFYEKQSEGNGRYFPEERVCYFLYFMNLFKKLKILHSAAKLQSKNKISTADYTDVADLHD